MKEKIQVYKLNVEYCFVKENIFNRNVRVEKINREKTSDIAKIHNANPVSYTRLDVYKRQDLYRYNIAISKKVYI